MRYRLLAFVAAITLLLAESSWARGEHWQVFENCQEMSNAANDGDSFHVKAGGKEYIFRLYFVDAPETDNSFPDRVNEQAKYFQLNTAQTLQLGLFAEQFTKEKLARPFRIRTCMQDALGRSRKERFYAFVETSEGDLAELLVANGMARVHGTLATPVGLNSPLRERDKLDRLEREAKQAKVGGWGAPAGRMTARLATQPSKTGPDSFDAFFHPERTSSSLDVNLNISLHRGISPAPAASAAPTDGETGGKLDPNTATSADLLGIPGIGPVIAERIIAARPFKSADDLRNVKGIGEKKFAKIRPFFAPPPETTR